MMISIARRNLSSLVSNPDSSFFCISIPHLLPSIHPFSTSIIPSPEIVDVLVNKHQFCPESASLASSRFPQFRSPKRADSVQSFLKENSFTTPQLEKIVLYDPRILGYAIEGLEFKFKVFHDLGLSSEEIAKIMSSSRAILHSSLANKIIPRLSVLMGLLGSNEEVARLLRKSSWFITSDLEKTLMPNVEIFKSRSISMDRIHHFIYVLPRCFLIKPDIIRKSIDKAIEIGVYPTYTTFVHAISILCYTSEAMWEVKLQTFRNLGFSDDDVFAIFRKDPIVFSKSPNKLKNVVEFLLATGKYNISSIVTFPAALGRSVEKRLEPRLQILGVLESRNLIKKWPCLSVVSTYTNDKFFDKFIGPYSDEIGKEHVRAYISRVKIGAALEEEDA